MQNSEFTHEEQELIQREFEALLDDYSHTRHRQKVEIITRAFEFANKAHYGVRRLSGEPYIMHPLAVARIVVKEIGLGSTSICSALLHDVVEDTDCTVEEIEQLFNPKIAQIVDGLTKISGGVFGEKASEQAENFRKLLLTMSNDIRVVLIKIADRLHNMRTLGSQPKDKQYKIAGETLYIYAPLAHRLGLFPIKTELENLSFKYEHPDTYAEIEAKLNDLKEHQMLNYERFVEPIREKLTGMGYKFSITARIKTVYSIWKKMQQKNIPFEDVYDLLAVRIVFTPNESMSEKDQCWMIYSALTEIYRPHPGRIRDWISMPKSNGYEALHVTVMGPEGQWTEVQIRTERMHEVAEKGLAAHWKYKTGIDDESELDKWLRNLREVLSNPEPDAMEFLDTFKLNLFAQEVFVFTPKGDIKALPQGATVLDLAFMLHSEVGEHCIGAKVNHNLKPMNYTLKSGDQVEILTSQTQAPEQEWTNWATTAKAQTGLLNYFKREERLRTQEGEQLFNNMLEAQGLAGYKDTVLQRVLNYYHIRQPQQLFLLLGRKEILLGRLTDIAFPKKSIWKRLNPFSSDNDDKQPKEAPKTKTTEEPKKKESKFIVLTDDNIGKQYHQADCCHPIPGDEVLGYKDDKGIIYIHKVDCPEAQKLKTSQGKRIYAATWDTHRVQSFIERIELKGVDKFGVLIRVLNIITSDFHINMRKIDLTAEDGFFMGTLDVYIYDNRELEDLFKALKKIPEILTARRAQNIS
ncbi:MAG: bifunctional (p)ppGpp synthetase/guanosine-3',5'-bis(diphosphate) 3'-pyrophosphohydrolase [Paludibacteraceae bacterium]|nr:bifunctional (p)ppGpp synthetase/guanosine-3',5'-bis(diphosphate) 3'-pyrophosphohydrolase [Paludibacteraceae bacterium]